MKQANSLDRLIRKVNGDTKATSSTEKVVIIDRKKGQAIPKKPWFGGDLAFFLVSNTDDPSNIAERKGLVYNVRDVVNDRQIDISINYWASCDSGNEDKVAEALYSNNSLRVELDKKVEKWIAKFIRDNDAARVIDNYYSQVVELRNFVKNNIYEESGINLDLKISLDQEDKLEPFPISPINFSVNVCDHDDKLDLQLQTELKVDEANKVQAILNSGQSLLLVNLIKREVRQYLAKNITINQFCNELKDSVRDELITYLNSKLRSYGRQVSDLYLSSNFATEIPEDFSEIKHSVECEIQDPEPIWIQVNNILQLTPKNLGKYRAAKSPDLETWSKDELNKIVKSLIFDKTYIQILLYFQPTASEIKKKMDEEAKLIGYEVKHIVSVPKLEPLELKKDFDIEIKNETFATNDADVEVKLDIIVTAKIPDLTKIKDYLSPNINVKELMKVAIHNATRRLLNTIDAERFFMRFYHEQYFSDEQTFSEKLPVAEELKQSITNALTDEPFYAQVINVVIKPLTTGIKECYKQLHKQICSFEFTISSLQGGEDIPMQADFQIEGVDKDSWYTFQSRQPTIEDIRSCIQKSIYANLSTIASNFIQYTSNQLRQEMQKQLESCANESVIKQFGLIVSLSNLSRKRTKREERYFEAQQKEFEVKLQEPLTALKMRENELNKQLKSSSISNEAEFSELDKLYRRREQIIDLEDNEDELKELNKKIKKKKKKISKASMEDVKNKLNTLTPSKSDTNSILGFQEQMKALSPETDTDQNQEGKSD